MRVCSEFHSRVLVSLPSIYLSTYPGVRPLQTGPKRKKPFQWGCRQNEGSHLILSPDLTMNEDWEIKTRSQNERRPLNNSAADDQVRERKKRETTKNVHSYTLYTLKSYAIKTGHKHSLAAFSGRGNKLVHFSSFDWGIFEECLLRCSTRKKMDDRFVVRWWSPREKKNIYEYKSSVSDLSGQTHTVGWMDEGQMEKKKKKTFSFSFIIIFAVSSHSHIVVGSCN